MDDKPPITPSLQCKNCGCCDLRLTQRPVRQIVHKGAVPRRYRYCRHCGKVTITHERIVDDD